MDKESNIFIIGHDDVIERSLAKHLRREGYSAVRTVTEEGVNVCLQKDVDHYFSSQKVSYVFLASLMSGGIELNRTRPAEFIVKNILGQSHVIHAAWQNNVKKLLYFGSSCAYPKDARQPIQEVSLMTGPLEATSEAYATAKIAGIRTCQAYRRQYGFNAITAVPATIYGPDEKADPKTAHVLGALIGRFYEAARDEREAIELWGSGKPKREFIYSDDFVRAAVFLMDNYDDEGVVNIGVGEEITIKALAEMIAGEFAYQGKIRFDTSRPDGAMRKILDNKRLTALGWSPQVSLKEGVHQTCTWYDHINKITTES